MFDQVAAGYDRTNSVMTVGNDALWRAAATRAVAPKRGERILDLGAGTASSSASFAASGAEVVAADFSPGMLAEGKRRHGHLPNLSFVQADATNLPFADNEFDAVSMSYALRNVQDPKKALAELFRVTKPGGRLVINEFSTPPNPIFRGFYKFYNSQVLPRVARVAGTNSEAYDYLNESIQEWPDQRRLSSWIREAGWSNVAYRNLSFGMVALHRATKPVAAPEL